MEYSKDREKKHLKNEVSCWIIRPAELVEDEENILFNRIIKSDFVSDIQFNEQESEFVIREYGMYRLSWDLNIATISRKDIVRINLILSDSNGGRENIIKRIRPFNINMKTSITRNIGEIIFRGKDGDRCFFRNVSRQKVEIIFLNSAVGGKIKLVRLR